MNPELPQSRPSAENVPQTQSGLEAQPIGPERGFETAPIPERGVSTVETVGQPPVVLPAVDPSTLAVPAVGAPIVAQDDSATDDSALSAGDVDLIEKEWVDRVKRMITLTKGDPYERGLAVTQLQAEYLKKRFNKTLGQSEE